jgi:hypothetical protein
MLQLLSRPGCGLCEDVAIWLDRLGSHYETVDIDSDPGLVELYGYHIPVLLLDGREAGRAPLTFEDVKAVVAGSRQGAEGP